MRFKNILANWDALIEKQNKGYYGPARDPKSMNLVVWVAVHDTADSYEVDEEWVGITKEGKLWWAYASGCSCWDGDYNTSAIKDIKTFQFDHKEVVPEEWKKALKEFDASLEIVHIKVAKDWDKRNA